MATSLLPRDIAHARRLFFDGEALPQGLLPLPLLRSWERAVAAGIRPNERRLFNDPLSTVDIRRVEEKHRPIIDLASQDILNLWNSIRSPNWVVLFTNADGTIVHSIGQRDRAPRELGFPLQCGRRLPESDLGANAPAIVLSERDSVVVQGDEHYLEELCHFTCAAAPVFALDGALAGVLDATGFDVPMDPRTPMRVSLAAQSIENRLFESAQSDMLFALHEDPRFLGTPLRGLVLVREDGRILSANRAAKLILGIEHDFVQRAQTVMFDQLFDQHLDKCRSVGERGAPVAIYTALGARLYLELIRDVRQSIVSEVPVATRDKSSGDQKIESLMIRAELVFSRSIPVLIQGETGTGKEWFARHLHARVRPGKPFVAINCSAIAESLAEAELFGHEEGAFTGSRKGGAAGKIEQANGGTLFLDEIGDMPLPLQTRLLRALQERSIVRLGGRKEIKLDILVVSATHRDMGSMVKEGAFREDLYFRLRGFSVQLPALRERSDLKFLIDQMLHEFTGDGQTVRLTEPVRQRLLAYDWPGNIRQLRHVLEVARALAGREGDIGLEALPDELQSENVTQLSGLGASGLLVNDVSMQTLKAEWATSALAKHNGNVSAAAKALGVSRTTFYKYLQQQPGSN